MAQTANHDVIMDGYAQCCSCLNNVTRYRHVIGTGCRISAWVIVHHDKRGRAQLKGTLHYFTGIDRDVIDRSPMQFLVGNEGIPAVKKRMRSFSVSS